MDLGTYRRMKRLTEKGTMPEDFSAAEVAESREAVKEELLSLREDMLERGREDVEKNRQLRPLVAILRRPGSVDFSMPVYGSPEEKVEVYEEINHSIRAEGAIGAVQVFDGWWLPSEHDDGEARPSEHPEGLEAVVICCLMRGWQRMFVYPYEREDEEVTWLEEVVKKDFKHNLLTAFRES